MSDRHAAGPILEAGDTARAVIEAIRQLDPAVTVVDRGAYLRVSCHRVCVLERARVEALLAAPFELPGALEQIMPSFQGAIRLDGDRVTWTSGA